MGGAKAHYDGVVAFSQTDFTEDLKKITVPVLVMHGDDDQVVPYATHLSVARTSLRAVYRSQYFSATVLPSMVAWPWSKGVPLMLPAIMISPT